MTALGSGSCAACGANVIDSPLCASCDQQARAGYVRVSGDARGSYDASLFAVLEHLEPKSFWFRARNRLIAWTLSSYFPDTGRLLEIGCGTGFVLASIRTALPELRVMGSELFPEGLEVARRRMTDAPLVQMDALDIPFRGVFDIVGAFDVLEHIDDDEAVLREIAKATVPGGGLIVTVPQHPRLWSAMDDFAGHLRRYTRLELAEKARRSGWEPIRLTSFVSLPLPLFALSRAMAANKSASHNFERELRLPRAIDRTLDVLMRAEQFAIEHGVSLPVGASLLFVARRSR